MAINKKLINFKREEDFNKELESGNILDKSIVFIDDSQKIFTHKTTFNSITLAERNKLENIENFVDDKIAALCNYETYNISSISLNPKYITLIKTASPITNIVGNEDGTYNFIVKFHTFLNKNYVAGALTIEINGVKNTVTLPSAPNLSENFTLEFNNVKYDSKENLVIKLIPNWGANLEYLISDFTLSYKVKYVNEDFENDTSESFYENAEAVLGNPDAFLTKNLADKLYIQGLNQQIFIWVGTQAEYSELASYDENTIYFIKEE